MCGVDFQGNHVVNKLVCPLPCAVPISTAKIGGDFCNCGAYVLMGYFLFRGHSIVLSCCIPANNLLLCFFLVTYCMTIGCHFIRPTPSWLRQ